jgi:hypothetical protein
MKGLWTLMAVGIVGASLALAPMTYAEEGAQGNKAPIQVAAKKKAHKHHHGKKKASASPAASGESKN